MFKKIALTLNLLLITGLAACGSTQFGATSARTAAETNGLNAQGATAPVKLTTISVTPAAPTLPLGTTQQFVATGNYSDGSKKDLTASATWSVAQASVAAFKTVSTPALLTGLSVGQTAVTATSGGVTGSVTAAVTAASLVSIAITPNPVAATYGQTTQLKAVGTYSDGTTATITDQVTWASATTGVATISNTAGTNGLLTPVDKGTSEISATFNGVTASAPASVSMVLACTTPESIVNSSGTVELTWSGVASSTTFTIAATSANAPAALGTVAATPNATGIAATYVGPAAAASEVNLTILATPSDSTIKPAACLLRLAADGSLGVPDDGKTNGLVGNVYQGTNFGTANTYVFNTMINWASNPAPVATIVMPNIDVPTRDFTQGFPGLPNLTVWFAIKFDGQISLPTTGAYTFQTLCDDGCNVYIDKTLVVNDDGVHATATAASAATQLTAGEHAIHIDYFQGPPTGIALVLNWQVPGTTAMVPVPATAFSRPAAVAAPAVN